MFGTKWLTGFGKEVILMVRDMADVVFGPTEAVNDDSNGDSKADSNINHCGLNDVGHRNL